MASSDHDRSPATLELYGRAMASASCGITIADMTRPDRPLIYCNQAFEVITGYSRQDVLGRNCRFMQGEGTSSAMVDQLRQAIRKGETCEVVLLNYRKDGRPFWNRLSIGPVHDAGGRLTHYIGVQTDVTESVEARHRASRQFQEEQLLNGVTQRIRQALDLDIVLSTTVNEVRDLLQTDRVLVYRFDSDWNGLVVAESVGEQWLPSLNMAIKDTCFRKNRAQDYHQGRISAIKNIETASLSDCHRDLLRRFQVQANLVLPIADSGKLWGLLIAHHCQEPRQWLPGEIKLLERLANQLAVAVMQAELYEQAQLEIQRRQQAEAQLAEKASQLEAALQALKWQQSQLVQAERLAGLEQLVAGVAHEINNPVAFIAGNISHAGRYIGDLLALLTDYQREMLAGGLTPSIDLQEHLEDVDPSYIRDDWPRLLQSMRSGVDRIQKIIQSLRVFSRLDEAIVKTIDLNANLDSALLLFQGRLNATGGDRPIQLVREFGLLLPMTCYPGQLNQALAAIVDNAIDALQLAVQQPDWQARGEQPTIVISTAVQTGQEVISVRIRDNAMGIPEALHNRIFDPFFSTKPIGQGTGLGLSMAYQTIVDQHGGRLQFESVIGRGTTFAIELPCQLELGHPRSLNSLNSVASRLPPLQPDSLKVVAAIDRKLSNFDRLSPAGVEIATDGASYHQGTNIIGVGRQLSGQDL
ncbi:MAG: GAF domain-containing protein [Oscillatoriales cyanobacterium]|nr:MAG: GAF domain-containing protein [Oscillatoriales cyanobacterium]